MIQLFSGSIQFFRDKGRAIGEAATVLKPRGRIVIAHVNGAKFVRQECKKNPSVAARYMPNTLNIETMATLAAGSWTETRKSWLSKMKPRRS